MRPVLSMALAATLLASGALALWADPPEAADSATVAAPVRRPVVATGPADRGAAVPASASASNPALAPAAAVAPDLAPDPSTADAPATAQLPTRAADWPAPTPAGLAAWQAAQGTDTGRAPGRGAAGAVAAAPAGAASRPAPVFPYRWIGQLDDGDGAPQQLLASEQRSVGVRPGATLDGRWRLLRNDAGRLLAQALPDGETVPVPGAPAALP